MSNTIALTNQTSWWTICYHGKPITNIWFLYSADARNFAWQYFDALRKGLWLEHENDIYALPKEINPSSYMHNLYNYQNIGHVQQDSKVMGDLYANIRYSLVERDSMLIFRSNDKRLKIVLNDIAHNRKYSQVGYKR